MSRPTRRQAIGVATGAAASIALVGTAATSPGAASAAPGKTEAPAPGPAPFDEVFQGRRIQGAPAATDAHAHGQGHAGHDAVYRVWIDGRELHVMQHGSSGWSSAINHYERFATPLDTARTAVASLKGAHVVPFDHTA
ncbi:tyrosinase cofactor [Streptomyces californicus]|uniref:apotyrosinase chaperone MelC1 n=1 Tax=Streptomyces californicus TaxID=67351 RepID=UPI0034D95CC4